MPNLSELSNGTKVLLAAGVGLLVATFLPWQKVSASLGGVELVSVSRNAWSGVLGILMGLVLIALLAWVALQVTNANVKLDLPVPDTTLVLALGVAVFALALLKNIADEYSAWGSYLGVLLAAGVAAGAWLRSQELREPARGASPAEPAPPEPGA
jgi:hypothetical protein